VCALALVALWPSDARLSGSSEVRIDSAHFRAELQSVRKIFDGSDPDQEQRWHANWKREARPRLKKIADKVAAALPDLVKEHGGGVELAPFDARLREFDQSIDEPDPDARPPKGKPCRYLFRFEDGVRLSVAFAEMPPRKVRRQLERALKKLL
jgi:hypothetical protein